MMQTAAACHRPDAPPGASSTGASVASVASPARGGAGATRAVQRALNFIDACFAEPISLTDLAAAAGLSVSRFAVRFSTEIGVSPQQYVRIVRVRQAQRLLRRGVSPSVAATEVGFFDQSHLCRHFKRVLGHTPREWLSLSAPAANLPVPDLVPLRRAAQPGGVSCRAPDSASSFDIWRLGVATCRDTETSAA